MLEYFFNCTLQKLTLHKAGSDIRENVSLEKVTKVNIIKAQFEATVKAFMYETQI